jgi:hypothetical protein
MQTQTGQQQTIEATIIRANGKREDLGVIVGGNPIQKVVSYLRIKISNFKQCLRYLPTQDGRSS